MPPASSGTRPAQLISLSQSLTSGCGTTPPSSARAGGSVSGDLQTLLRTSLYLQCSTQPVTQEQHREFEHSFGASGARKLNEAFPSAALSGSFKSSTMMGRRYSERIRDTRPITALTLGQILRRSVFGGRLHSAPYIQITPQ